MAVLALLAVILLLAVLAVLPVMYVLALHSSLVCTSFGTLISCIIISRPGRSQGLLYKQPRDSLTDSVSLFLPQLYGAATPKRLEIALLVIK